MGFFSLFKASKPTQRVIIIRNVLGEEIDRLEGMRDLVNADLRGRQWAHADLGGMSLFGANLDGANLIGARLVRTSFYRANLAGAELSYCDAWGADFQNANLVGTTLYRSNVRRARFDGSIQNEHTDIPGRRVTGLMRVVA